MWNEQGGKRPIINTFIDFESQNNILFSQLDTQSWTDFSFNTYKKMIYASVVKLQTNTV